MNDLVFIKYEKIKNTGKEFVKFLIWLNLVIEKVSRT